MSPNVWKFTFATLSTILPPDLFIICLIIFIFNSLLSTERKTPRREPKLHNFLYADEEDMNVENMLLWTVNDMTAVWKQTSNKIVLPHTRLYHLHIFEIKEKTQKEHKTEPCGTPALAFRKDDFSLLRNTHSSQL